MFKRRITGAPSLLNSGGSTAWTCPSCLRATSPPIPRQAIQPAFRRNAHSVSHPTSHEKFLQVGVPGLYTANGYREAWVNTQTMYVNKLNELLAGSEYENTEVKELTLRTARDPTMASVFNHASMAFNNHFWVNGFSLSPQKLDEQPRLQESLTRTFGTIDTLRVTLIDTAAAMFGPGFVWLVYCRDLRRMTGRSHLGEDAGQWRILPTYLAGTPFPEAGYRQQGIDMNTSNAAGFAAYRNEQVANHVGSFGDYTSTASDMARRPPGGTSVMPVLCVNTWQTSYLTDFGVDGKRQYLNDWWDTIDWSAAATATPKEAFRTYGIRSGR